MSAIDQAMENLRKARETLDEIEAMIEAIPYGRGPQRVGLDEMRRDRARAAILAWAASPGFAAVHTGAATNEAIADHLIRSLWEAGFKIVPLEDGDLF
jgi:hypothetical protein